MMIPHIDILLHALHTLSMECRENHRNFGLVARAKKNGNSTIYPPQVRIEPQIIAFTGRCCTSAAQRIYFTHFIKILLFLTSKGTGRTEGLKLYRPISPMLSQLARSLALANAVDSPMIRNRRDVCDSMKFVLYIQ